ncbi:MAG TPA: hypothetical protein PL182_07740, partial [Pseudobdellovibrionaceae bacterium]|nr:hypothetical protein [Pseudobdellovibrionaceae bacterium]
GGNASIGGNASGFTGSLSGDVTGGQASTKVEALQGNAVSAGPPSDKQVLTWNHAQSRWEAANLPVAGNPEWDDIINAPASLPPSGDAGGDLDGTYPNPVIADHAVTANKISDGSISGAKLQAGSADGQVFRFASGSWNIGKLNYKDLVNSFGNSP